MIWFQWGVIVMFGYMFPLISWHCISSCQLLSFFSVLLIELYIFLFTPFFHLKFYCQASVNGSFLWLLSWLSFHLVLSLKILSPPIMGSVALIRSVFLSSLWMFPDIPKPISFHLVSQLCQRWFLYNMTFSILLQQYYIHYRYQGMSYQHYIQQLIKTIGTQMTNENIANYNCKYA